MRRDHRVRLADGRDVRRAAVPPERPRLLDASTPGSRSSRRRSSWCSSRRGRRRSSRRDGARFTLLVGYVFVLLGFLTMLLLWKEDIDYWKVGLGYAFVGIGVGFAGTPASHSLTGSVPVTARRDGVGHRRPPARPRRGDHAVDLRRAPDGRLRGGGRSGDHEPRASTSPHSVQNQLTKSFSGAEDIAQQYPQYASQITAGGEDSRSSTATSGRTSPGIVAVLLGAALVFLFFPNAGARAGAPRRVPRSGHQLDTRRSPARDTLIRRMCRRVKGSRSGRKLPGTSPDRVAVSSDRVCSCSAGLCRRGRRQEAEEGEGRRRARRQA